MSRYTEYLKEKVMCCICKRESRGHIGNHLKSKIHIKNTKKKEEEEAKKLKEPIIIDWN